VVVAAASFVSVVSDYSWRQNTRGLSGGFSKGCFVGDIIVVFESREASSRSVDTS
jgi:hypothetical protein